MNVILIVCVVAASLLSTQLWIFPGWFDSGELALGAQVLGVSHAPGEPTYNVLGKMFTLLPIGTVAFRTSLFSLVCGVGAAALAAFITQRLLRWVSTLSERMILALSLSISVLLLLHASIALQIARTEVYAPQLFFSLLLFSLGVVFLKTEDERVARAGAVASGLAFGVHPLIAMTLVPLLAAPLVVNRTGRILRVFSLLPWLLLGSLVQLALPVRAATNPLLNWDDPAVFRRFWSLLTALDFQRSFQSPFATGTASRGFTETLGVVFPLPFLTLAILGSLFLAVRLRWKSAPLLGTVLLTVSPWLTLPFVPRNPDMHGYVSTSIALCLILAVIGGFGLLRYLPIRAWLKASLAVTLLAFSSQNLFMSGFSAWRADGGAAAEVLSGTLDRVPPASAVTVRSDHWYFPLLYATSVEGRRPDVRIAAEGLLRAGWYRRQIRARYGSASDDGGSYFEILPVGSAGTNRRLGLGPDEADMKRRFSSICRQELRDDPFEIQAAICATVIANWVAELARVGEASQGARLLEEYLGLPRQGIDCVRPRSLSFPFPLYRSYTEPFLMDPDLVQSELILLYLGCGRPDLAEHVARSALGQDIDALLLSSAMLWERGQKEAAVDLLEKADVGKRSERGVLDLAAATLRFLLHDVERGDLLLARAETVLGRENVAIRRLKEEFKR